MIGGCLKRLFLLALVLLVAAGAWLYRDRIRTAWDELRGVREAEAPQPTEEIAARASARIDSLAERSLERAAFSELELQSLLTFRFAGIMPAFVDNPRVALDGEQIQLGGRVPLDRLPSTGALGEVAMVLPDTSDVTLSGTLLPLPDGRVAVAVDEITAARIPLPRRIVPTVLRHLGRTREPGLPEDAIAVRLPPGVSSAYVRNDSLVLIVTAQPR